MSPTNQGADLSAIFNMVTQALAANRSSLNDADVDNHNHGDNMVQTFNMISQAMANEHDAPPSQQLQQASNYLSQNAHSGSGQIYAQGLSQAAQQLQGQPAVTQDNAMTLIASLLGGGQQPVQQQGQSDGLDLGDLVNAGMAFMSAKQQGQDNVQAALTALLSSSPLGQTQHRQQSGQIVGNTLLQAIAGMSQGR